MSLLDKESKSFPSHTDANAGPSHMQAKGGSFVGDNKDFFRFRLGERAVIPAFEEAVQTMRVRGRLAAV